MTAAMVSLIMTVLAVIVFLISGGRDRVRMVIGALWGVTLGAAFGGSVAGALGTFFGMLGGLFGV